MVTFLSNIKIDKLRKISNEEKPEENKIMIPEVGLEISDDTIKVEENF
jgi:hypothetical protein